MNRKKVTLHDVARLAQVSKSTISLVMLNRPGIGEETRERVFAAARQLGYEAPRRKVKPLPSPPLAATGSIAFLVEEKHFFSGEVFYTRIFAGVKDQVEPEGLNLNILTVSDAQIREASLPAAILRREVAAVLVAGEMPASYLEQIALAGLPVVLVEFESTRHPWLSVVVDNIAGARDAVRHLVELGHKRILCLASKLNHPSIQERIMGYRLVMAEAFGRVEPELFCPEEGEPSIEHGFELMGRRLTRGLDFSAIFAVTDGLAIGALKALQVAGIEVPGQVSLVGFDNLDWSSHTMPPLTTINIHRRSMGQIAAQYLLQQLRASSGAAPLPQHRILVPVHLVVRDSTAPFKS